MPIEKDGKIMLTITDLKPIVEGNGIVNGTKGGLILGNHHNEGGIKVIRQYNNEELYEVIAEIEGWEYVLSPLTTIKELEYLKKLNAEFVGTTELFEEFEIPSGINILDTKPIFENIKVTNKLVLISEYSQFIVNKFSTKKYLIQLDNLNKKYSR
jgi:hypothetical protein